MYQDAYGYLFVDIVLIDGKASKVVEDEGQSNGHAVTTRESAIIFTEFLSKAKVKLAYLPAIIKATASSLSHCLSRSRLPLSWKALISCNDTSSPSYH